ncbi:MAG: hypothetical protein J6J31_07600 [Thermoguttaceae bacterium]|nr:hypothetical protein [Thermoguttaceae bacterium]
MRCFYFWVFFCLFLSLMILLGYFFLYKHHDPSQTADSLEKRILREPDPMDPIYLQILMNESHMTSF